MRRGAVEKGSRERSVGCAGKPAHWQVRHQRQLSTMTIRRRSHSLTRDSPPLVRFVRRQFRASCGSPAEHQHTPATAASPESDP